MLASASPRKPYVPMEVRSSKALSFDVVKRSHSIGKSSFYKSSVGDRVAHCRTDINPVPIVCDLEKLEAPVFH